MRIGKRGFDARIKGDLHIEFGGEKLTSYAGLELVRRFLKGLKFFAELRRVEQEAGAGGDFSFGNALHGATVERSPRPRRPLDPCRPLG